MENANISNRFMTAILLAILVAGALEVAAIIDTSSLRSGVEASVIGAVSSVPAAIPQGFALPIAPAL